MTCRRCRGTDFAKLSQVYEQTKQQARTPLRGAPFQAGASPQQIMQQRRSLLFHTAPPQRARIKPIVTLGVVAIAVSGFSLSAILFALLLSVGVVIAVRYNTMIWPRSYEAWTRKLMCRRCGTIAAAPGPSPLVPQRSARVVSVRVDESPPRG